MSCILNKIDDDFNDYVKFCEENNFYILPLTPLSKKEKELKREFGSFYKHWDYLKQ
jgi:hypothetical protein